MHGCLVLAQLHIKRDILVQVILLDAVVEDSGQGVHVILYGTWAGCFAGIIFCTEAILHKAVDHFLGDGAGFWIAQPANQFGDTAVDVGDVQVTNRTHLMQILLRINVLNAQL